jgi:ubiquinone/menaquinone biosynthesis C-methylase UbiE
MLESPLAARLILHPHAMYVCPKCKGELRDLRCERCAMRYPLLEGVPCFMAGEAQASDQKIREVYDDIYLHHTDVWLDQGRSGDFQQYFADLVRSLEHQRILEIGCGEGSLLATLPGTSKFGIDPSVQALLRAQRRCNAECAVARCEHLPFPAEAFNVVVAVGVMEHFEVIDAAVSEICRVLSPSGHYIALIQTDMTRSQRVALKVRQYLYPRFRPIALAQWFGKCVRKKRHPIVQSLRKSYTEDSATDALQRNGLRVERIITERSEPSAPLGGSHVVILISSKRPRQ